MGSDLLVVNLAFYCYTILKASSIYPGDTYGGSDYR
jgi:hypothetical protein